MTRVLFIIYTPNEAYVPKRMAQLKRQPLWKEQSDEVRHITVTPYDYLEKLYGVEAETVHLMELIPDTSISAVEVSRWHGELKKVKDIVEKIKIHNM